MDILIINRDLHVQKNRENLYLIDFKGHACANCKLMEAKVWSDPEVLRRLGKTL